MVDCPDESRKGSPFTEIFSGHGCSETDEEWVGLRRNPAMGPGQGGGTWQDALDRGLHVGCICSTDNWLLMPGCYGRGRMACLATELTRAGLWEAFKARRVYGVTGDRILIDFRVNNAPMGSILRARGPRRIHVGVRGCDALDRIEVLRNGRVIATHGHQGTWRCPRPGERSKWKLRVEAGWGPDTKQLSVPEQSWRGEVAVPGGRLIGWEPCWITPGQGRATLGGESAQFTLLTSPSTVQERSQNADIFEFEADAGAEVRVTLNGLTETASVTDLARGSRIVWFRAECVRLLEARCGVAAGSPDREDVYWHLAHKAKIHRPVPEAAYTATLEFEDDEEIAGEVHYRVRVEQRNGQRAWGSPVWITAEG